MGSKRQPKPAGQPSRPLNVITLRVNPEFKKRLNLALAAEGAKLQTKGVELLEQYVESVEHSATEHERRMRMAREHLERYKRTFQELAK